MAAEPEGAKPGGTSGQSSTGERECNSIGCPVPGKRHLYTLCALSTGAGKNCSRDTQILGLLHLCVSRVVPKPKASLQRQPEMGLLEAKARGVFHL